MLFPRDLVARCATNFPDKVAYYCGPEYRTWRQMHLRSDALAGAMAELGLGKGDSVAILGQESFEIYEHFFACMKMGAMRVGVNWRYTPAQLLHILSDSAAKAVLVQATCLPLIQSCRAEIDRMGILLIGYGGRHPFARDYESLLARSSGLICLPELDPEDPLLCTYTSGTTGNPKGVAHKQAAIAKMIFQSLVSRGLSPDDIWYTAAASSWMTVVLNMLGLGNGMSHIIMDGRFDIAQFLRDIETRRATAVMLVPTMIRRAIEECRRARYDLSSVRLLMYGSSPATPQLIREAYETFGCELIQSYGMTEGGWLCHLSASDHRRAMQSEPDLLKSVGRLGVMSEVSIRDPEGNPVPPGTLGDVWIRGETLMKGYLNLPQETAAVLRGDWLCTNDVGYVDHRGYLFLTDRKQFMIITGAVNIFPSSIETIIAEHPAVEEVAVVGAPHPEWGEAVAAVVKLRNRTERFPISELHRFCEGRLNRLEQPKYLYFIEEFPRSANGKIQKQEVKNWIAANVAMPPQELA